MEHFETSWETKDRVRIYAQGWEPIDEAIAVICLVNGLGEYSGRYAHLASCLCSAGYALMTFDLRGHGKSEGQRGFTPSMEVLLDDISIL